MEARAPRLRPFPASPRAKVAVEKEGGARGKVKVRAPLLRLPPAIPKVKVAVEKEVMGKPGVRRLRMPGCGRPWPQHELRDVGGEGGREREGIG